MPGSMVSSVGLGDAEASQSWGDDRLRLWLPIWVRTGRIRADVLLASMLPRAVETAQIIAPALGLQTVRQRCDLCEIHTGEADGLAWAEYAERYGSFDMEAEPERLFAPGGDSWTTFHQRVRLMCEQLAAEFSDQTVVAVCHAGVIMASIRVLVWDSASRDEHPASTSEYGSHRVGVRLQLGSLDSS